MWFNHWQIALIVYFIMIGILIALKPSLMFTAEGTIKTWSSQNTETTSLFSPMVVFPLLALLSYYLGIWIELLSI